MGVSKSIIKIRRYEPMSLSEKFRHQRKKEGSRARSQLHRHDGHKMASVVNHTHHERAELLTQMRKQVEQV